MQEQSAPEVNKHPVNDLAKLEPLLRRDALEEFKKCLVNPIGHEVYVQLLKWAIKFRAQTTLAFLSNCPLSREDGNKDKITHTLHSKYGFQLFNLLCYQYAEYFNSSDELRNLRTNLIHNISIMKNRNLLLAAVNGNVGSFFAALVVPEKPSTHYYPFVVYAAANNQLDVVRYFQGVYNFHRDKFFDNAVVPAILQNASSVFAYLIQTQGFNPNISLRGSGLEDFRGENTNSLLKLTICYHRFDQFLQLVEKGARITDEIFRLAIAMGDVRFIDYCAEKIPKFPEDAFEIAIKNAQPHLIRYLLGKGFSLTTMGNLLLCLAVVHNNLPIVHELVTLGVDIKEPIKQGYNAILVAIVCDNVIILKYLIDHLKTIMTAEALSQYLNEINVFTIHPKLIFYSGGFDNAHAIINLLLTEGATLIRNGFLSYDIPAGQSDRRLGCLNHLAVNQLVEIKELTLDYLPVIEQLCKFYETYYRQYQSNPRYLALSRRKVYLENYLKIKNSKLENWVENLLSPLAYMIAFRLDNTISLFCAYIDELLNQHGSAQNISPIIAMTEMLRTLPKSRMKHQICLAIADKISTYFLPQDTNRSLVLAARWLYDAANTPKQPGIDQKIAACIEKCGSYVLCLNPASEQQQNNLFDELIRNAMQLGNVSILNNVLDDRLGLLSLPKNYVESIRLFNEIISLCRNQPNFLQDLINFVLSMTHVRASNKICLCLLLNRDLDQVTKHLGVYLHRLTQNTPRRLFIIAHILTYYSGSIVQPNQVRDIFHKALSELANLTYNGIEAFHESIQTHYKEILVAILNIRLELIELLAENCQELKSRINSLNTQNDQEFALSYQVIAGQISQIINQELTQVNLSLSTAYLDQIANSCVKHFDHLPDFSPVAAGKRPPVSPIETLEYEFRQL